MTKKVIIAILTVLFLATFAFGETNLNYNQKTGWIYNPIATATKTTTYTVLSTDDYLIGNTTSASFTMTLPTIASLTNAGIGSKSYKFLKSDSTAYVLTVAAATGNTIGGEASRKIINQNGYMIIHSQGTDWIVDYETPYVNENHYAGTTGITLGTSTIVTNTAWDDGVTDSPSLTIQDATDETLVMTKVDGSSFTMTLPANRSIQVTTGNLKVGNGSPALAAMNGEDFYVEGETELAGAVFASGLVTFSGGVIENIETVAATNIITAAECGKTFFLSHATEFVSTLPVPTTGCQFTFIVANAPETASYTIVTNASANIIIGVVGDALGGSTGSGDADADTITFTDSVAVLGDWVTVISDGTYWYVRGAGSAATAIVLTKAS